MLWGRSWGSVQLDWGPHYSPCPPPVPSLALLFDGSTNPAHPKHIGSIDPHCSVATVVRGWWGPTGRGGHELGVRMGWGPRDLAPALASARLGAIRVVSLGGPQPRCPLSFGVTPEDPKTWGILRGGALKGDPQCSPHLRAGGADPLC